MRWRQAPGSSWLRQRRTASLICWPLKLRPLLLWPLRVAVRFQVSNSWGGGEFSGETSLDSHFIQSGVVFFASTGDFPGTAWPSVAPNVVAAGGTTISRNPSTLAFITERPWAETGGGRSLFESIPTYQTSIASIVGSSRGVPDVSFDADPDTGVWVFDSTPVEGSTAGCCGVKGWWIVG